MSTYFTKRTAWAVASLAAIAALIPLLSGQTGPAAAPAAAADTGPALDPKQAFTTYGWIIGQRAGVKQLGLTTAEIDYIAAGMKLAMTSAPTEVPGGQDIIPKMQAYLEGRAAVIQKQESAKQEAEAQKFFADLDKNPKVKKTASGLYYEIVTPGADPKPKMGEVVTVKYIGKFINGTVFDQTSAERPTSDFTVGEVIPGWNEGLQLIGKGGKIKLYIPGKLAYGENGPPSIPPNSTLVFETEIVDLKAAPPPSAAQLPPGLLDSLGGQPPSGAPAGK